MLHILFFPDQRNGDREPLSEWRRQADWEITGQAATGGPKRSASGPGAHPCPGRQRLGAWRLVSSIMQRLSVD